MTLRDASLLAVTKFKTRKARSIMVVLGTSFLTALVLILSLTYTGIRRSINGAVSPLADLHLAQSYVYGALGSQQSTVDGSLAPDSYTPPTDEEVIQTFKLKKDTVKNIYFNETIQSLSGISFAEFPDGASSNFGGGYIYPNSIELADRALIEPYLAEGQNMNPADGVIPIIISSDFVTAKHAKELSSITDTEQAVKKRTELQEGYIGKIMDATAIFQDTAENGETKTREVTVRVKIVGYLPSSGGFFGGLVGSFGSNILIPKDSLKNTILESESRYYSFNQTVYVSFNNSESRREGIIAINESGSGWATSFGDASGSVYEMTRSIKKIVFWLIVVLIIFVTIPMMGTLGKILADSQRETGVFRAIGARNTDIAMIYAVYSAILAMVAFVVAAVISTLFALFLTLKFSPKLSSELTQLVGSSHIIHVRLIGINVLHWLVLLSLLISAALLGAVIPVLRTLHKDPILAMRDE